MQVTYEAPPGLRNNLQRTYSSWSQQFLEDGGRGGAVAGAAPAGLRPQLLFLLAWFHALVQERCQYVPQVRQG
jgi:dynein heavy chain 2